MAAGPRPYFLSKQWLLLSDRTTILLFYTLYQYYVADLRCYKVKAPYFGRFFISDNALLLAERYR